MSSHGPSTVVFALTKAAVGAIPPPRARLLLNPVVYNRLQPAARLALAKAAVVTVPPPPRAWLLIIVRLRPAAAAPRGGPTLRAPPVRLMLFGGVTPDVCHGYQTRRALLVRRQQAALSDGVPGSRAGLQRGTATVRRKGPTRGRTACRPWHCKFPQAWRCVA